VNCRSRGGDDRFAAAAEANVHVTAQYDTKNPQAMRKLVREGAQLRAFPRPVMEAAYKATFEFKTIYGPWRKYRDDAYAALRSRAATTSSPPRVRRNRDFEMYCFS